MGLIFLFSSGPHYQKNEKSWLRLKSEVISLIFYPDFAVLFLLPRLFYKEKMGFKKIYPRSLTKLIKKVGVNFGINF